MATKPNTSDPAAPEPLRKLADLVDVKDEKERMRHLLRLYDGLLAAALKERDFAAARNIMDDAQKLITRAQR